MLFSSDGSTRQARGSLLLVFLLTGLLALPSQSSPGPKKHPESHYALLMVSVFTEEGFALPGIAVGIKRQGARKPAWRVVSDRRGECAARLPPGRGTYEVATQSKQHENQTRIVEIYGEERVDLVLRLSPKKPERGHK